MLGILKPYKMELLLKDCMYYKLYYCSLCRHLVKNNHRLYAFLNSYEGTLIAMLYNEMVVQDIEAVKDRCSGLPIAKIASLPSDHEAVELGAFICLLAFQVKFQDNLLDETGFWITQYNRRLKNHVQKSFDRKEAVYAKFNIDLKWVHCQQEELHRLEQDATRRDLSQHLDCWGNIFSYILSQPFKGKIDPDRFAALKELFAGLGKVIYLLDSMTDLHQDCASGHFNLILKCEPSAGDRTNLKNKLWLEEQYHLSLQTIKREQSHLISLLPRLQLQESFAIVQNILTHCLDNEMGKVFEFMVLNKENTEKLLFNCKEF